MITKRPPITMQTIDSPFGDRGPSADVDAFSEHPLLDYLRTRLDRPTLTADPAPEMFSTGPLPPFTASGVDPETLRLVHWRIRHGAALASDRGAVLAMIDAGADGDAEAGLTTDAGERAWRDYVHRTWRWATAPAPVEGSPITLEAEREFWAGRTV